MTKRSARFERSWRTPRRSRATPMASPAYSRTTSRSSTSAAVACLARVYTKSEVVDVRFLRPDIALVSCVKHTSDEREPAERDPDAPVSKRGSQTFVLVRERGNWLFALA